MAKKKSRIIQVPMPESLVYSLDRLSEERGESRSAILREAAAQYVANADEAEKLRRYVEGYEKHPMSSEEIGWLTAAAEVTAARWTQDEDWSEEYANGLGPDDEAR